MMSAALWAALALQAAAPTVYGDTGTPDPAFAPYGLAVWQGLEQVCRPAAEGRRPLSRARGVTAAAFPPEWAIRSVTIGPGAPAYARRDLPKGWLLFATTPGDLCQEVVFDAPSGGRIFVSLDATLRDHGWRLETREDDLGFTHRTYQRGGPGRPGADLDLVEFVDGGGPVGHTRLRLTLKSYP